MKQTQRIINTYNKQRNAKQLQELLTNAFDTNVTWSLFDPVADLDKVTSLLKTVSPDRVVNKKAYKQQLRKRNRVYIVGYIDATLAFVFGIRITPNTTYLETLAIDTRRQHKGFGSKLMHVLDQYTLQTNRIHNSLHVDTSNEAALGLYEKHGYTIDSVNTAYYRNQADAYLMVKDIRHLKVGVG